MAFQDAWVVDKTMFEYVSQGGCSCCGLTTAMMNFAALADLCSDWETDDEERESFSPWPTFIHEDVQTQRALIRLRLKAHMPAYTTFWADYGDAFSQWWDAQAPTTKYRLFQLQDADVKSYVHTHGDVHGPYSIVLATVTEQIKQFDQTGYSDGRVPAELAFERHLRFEKGAFTLDAAYLASTDPTSNFCALVQHLGGPRLLPSHSFRSDRRVVRIVLARIFADSVIRKFKLAVAAE
ncbi:hypothetical protein ACHHYP_09086 [Achlya hypogyna]|uniref:Uncharacterized protein n=1 Tax=Achlya hypogyna TaxID=1202772 RepID=A0A1V9YNR0_ACHHY|nr:hypothetical protein ACHHYP_09086 [Achlya hypogyna]